MATICVTKYALAKAARRAAERVATIHVFSAVGQDPDFPNFCGKCGEYLTADIHLRTGETTTDAAERIIREAYGARSLLETVEKHEKEK